MMVSKLGYDYFCIDDFIFFFNAIFYTLFKFYVIMKFLFKISNMKSEEQNWIMKYT